MSYSSLGPALQCGALDLQHFGALYYSLGDDAVPRFGPPVTVCWGLELQVCGFGITAAPALVYRAWG